MKNKNPSRRFLIITLLLMLLFGLAGAVIGKYIQTITISSKVTFAPELAESIQLLEHEAVRNDDGSYRLTEKILPETDGEGNVITQGNQYILLPGQDIPKDPHIVITGKSSIPAYLFLEVVDTLEEKDGEKVYTPIEYQLTNHWKKLAGVTGAHQGMVYVYTGGEAKEKELTSSVGTSFTVELLAPVVDGKPETVKVSQHLKSQSKEDGTDLLTIYACMGEVALSNSKDPAEVYNAIKNIS